MNPWFFRDFRDANGQNVVLDWTQSLPLTAQAKIDNRILVLQAWSGPWPPLSPLHRKASRLLRERS
jgi:hypothetical protein